MPFHRPSAPAEWLEKERAWLAKCYVVTDSDDGLRLRPSDVDPLAWEWAGRSLRRHFRDIVFGTGDAHCAYCDGALDKTSGVQLDHYVPRSVVPPLAVSWDNLFPVCSKCNTLEKRARWSCRMVRPDQDPVADMFVASPTSFGVELAPSPSLSGRDRARVRRTIEILKLNQPSLMKFRNDVLQQMRRDIVGGFKPQPSEYRFLLRAL